MTTFISYMLDELTEGRHEGVMIRTNDGTELSIRVVNGKTLITFPFGNRLSLPETVGVLSSGVVVLPVERDKPLQSDLSH